MSRKIFKLTDEEVRRVFVTNNSDDEDGLQLDDEDQRFLTLDDDLGLQSVEIEDPIPWTPLEPSNLAEEPVREKHRTTSCQPDLKWNQTYLPNVILDVEYEYEKVRILPENETVLLTLFEIFKSGTNFGILVQCITAQTVTYTHQNGRELDVGDEEMKAFLGMNLVMGYHVLPSLRDYWSAEPDMAVPFISNIIPRNRFEDIFRKKENRTNNISPLC